MNIMKKWIVVLCVLAMIVSLAACGGNDGSGSASKTDSGGTDATSADEGADAASTNESADAASAGNLDRNGDGVVTIGYSSIAYAIASLSKTEIDLFQKKCDELGWELNMLTSEGDTMKQTEQVEQLIAMDPDYLLIWVGDSTLSRDYTQKATDAGIPVITIIGDSMADEDGTPDPNVTYYIGSNDYQMAYDVAKQAIEDNGADAGLGVVLMGGTPGMKDWIDRDNGFRDAITENSNYEILGETAWVYSSRADAQAAMEDFLNTYGDKVNIFLSPEDDYGLGGVYALQEAGRSDVQVYSITGTIEGVQAIKDGQIKTTARRSMNAVVDKTVECIENIAADGGTLDYYQYIETPFITIDNADQYPGEF